MGENTKRQSCRNGPDHSPASAPAPCIRARLQSCRKRTRKDRASAPVAGRDLTGCGNTRFFEGARLQPGRNSGNINSASAPAPCIRAQLQSCRKRTRKDRASAPAPCIRARLESCRKRTWKDRLQPLCLVSGRLQPLRLVSGHDLSRAENAPGKTGLQPLCLVSGHDLSRAENAPGKTGLQPLRFLRYAAQNPASCQPLLPRLKKRGPPPQANLNPISQNKGPAIGGAFFLYPISSEYQTQTISLPNILTLSRRTHATNKPLIPSHDFRKS